jgi:hypothetical protein
MIGIWRAPLGGGKRAEELLVSFDEGRERRILIVPALFDEANKLRRFTIQTMRALDDAGIDSFLPDLPGCNESLVPLPTQTLTLWRSAVEEAARHVEATHVLAIRGGANLAPTELPGWLSAPQTGPKVLRSMLRARIIAAREEGLHETSDELVRTGREEGLLLAGWQLGSEMVRELESAELADRGNLETIDQKQLPGAGLWLRAEPGDAPAQSRALAAILAGSQGDSS